MTLALGRLAGCRRGVTLAFDLRDLILNHGEPLDLPCNLAGESGWQTMSIAGHELIYCQGLVLGFDIDAPNALGEQQSFDPVDMRSPFPHQPAALTVRAPQILFLDAGNAHQRPNVPLTPAPGDQRSQQQLDVDPIGLNRTSAPVDLEAARVEHKALDAARFKKSRQPECVVADFIADRDRRNRTAHLGP